MLRDSINISVSDTGTGIPSEERENIFKRFYRQDQNRRRYYEGTGMVFLLPENLPEIWAEALGWNHPSGTAVPLLFRFRPEPAK